VTTWSQQMFDISTYVGQRVKARFRLGDNGKGTTAVGEGWSLDDVEIRELY
jgi:hypothetical protein